MRDTQFLAESSFSVYFNFSNKSDPFLVFPSTKHQAAVGGGAQGLKKIKGGQIGQISAIKKDKGQQANKLIVPLQNSLMKMVRQSEVYLMEEIVTESIIIDTAQKQRLDSMENEEKENDNVGNLMGGVQDFRNIGSGQRYRQFGEGH